MSKKELNTSEDHKKAIKELESEDIKVEALFFDLFDQNPISIWISDETGTFLKQNQASRDMWGAADETLIGKFNIFDDPFFKEEGTLHLVEKVFNQGETVKLIINYEPRIFKKLTGFKRNTRSVMEVTIAPIKDKNGKTKNAIIYQNDITQRVIAEEELKDITDSKKAEQKLKRIVEDLQRSNEELEQFAYIASHDLQEPLRSIASFAQLLQKRYKDKLDEEANEFINFVVDGAMRMQNLIMDLLMFSRVGTHGKPFKETDMNVTLNHVINMLSQSINETAAKITSDPLPVIFADESQMIQILQNLISNAIKFHGDDSPSIHISAKVNANEWVFSVKDNGIGIDPKYFEKIFVIFQRLHRVGEYEGTGIGLAVCKKIANRHGGVVWVVSKPGKGSTFYFTISKTKIING